ncbi:alkaline phosphatase family protein [Candidatus Mycalebacterium sp.]
MNTPRPDEIKRCVIMLIDGARKDVFEQLLSSGRLPNISRHIVEPGGFITASSVFPSTTGPAYTPYLLGSFPGKCDMPGIRWLDKKLWNKTLTFKRLRSYVSYEAVFLNSDLRPYPPTLFELIPSSVSIFNEMTRGLPFGRNLTAMSTAFHKIKNHFFEDGYSIDRIAADKLLRCFNGNAQDFPLFCFAVFMEVDSLSHKLHPFHKKVIDAYLKMDGIIGEIAEKLKQKGVLENTLLAIVSDHGLTATHTHFDLSKTLEREGFSVLEYPNIFRNFFGADCSVMVSGNSMAHIYLKNASNEMRGNVARKCASEKQIDLVMSLRENGRIEILSERGSAVVSAKNDTILYETNGGDPFGFEPMSGQMSKDAQLELTFKTDYPDALAQACQIFESSRTGDIVVSAKQGFDLRARFEFPEHKASHGSMIKDHISVPIALNAKIAARCARTVDIYPTVLEHMGIAAPENIDGKSLLV